MTTIDQHTIGPADDAATSGWLSGFRRITSSGRYIPEIDGIRFVAISMVLIYHVLVFVCIAKNIGIGGFDRLTRGVEMFFVLSGFILSVPFAAHFLGDGRRVKLKDYFLRRLTRLEPPYLLCVAIYAALKMYQYSDSIFLIFRISLLDAVYLHDMVLGRQGLIISVAWSLEVEVQFYLCMPLLAYLFAVRPAWLRRAILIACMLAIPLVQPIWFKGVYAGNDGHLLNTIQYFLAGLLLADVWVVEWKNRSPSAAINWTFAADSICIILFIILLSIPRDRTFGERFWLAPLIFLMYFLMFRGALIRRFMRVQIVTLIGGMCYSIYLLHNLIIIALGNLLSPHLPYAFWQAAIVSGLVLVPASLLVSAIYFKLIERPCMRRDWPQKLWRWFASYLFAEEEPVRTA